MTKQQVSLVLRLYHNLKLIKQNLLCLSIAVEIRYCEGRCGSMSDYHDEYPFFKVRCMCCLAGEQTVIPVILKCPGTDNDKVVTRSNVLSCRCKRCNNKRQEKDQKQKNCERKSSQLHPSSNSLDSNDRMTAMQCHGRHRNIIQTFRFGIFKSTRTVVF